MLENLLEAMRRRVQSGKARSINGFVRSAIEERIKTLERKELRDAMLRASKDPLFLNDVQECHRDLAALDAEAERRMPEW